MSKFTTRHEYITENTVNWLKDFADKQAEKMAMDNGIDLKNAGHIENILDIVNRKKKISVDDKVRQYRELVGMDIIENITKDGGNEPKQVTASRMVLSCREKTASEDQKIMDNIKQYITDIIKNRNGSIATPAIIDQLEHYMKVGKEWLREREDEILSYIKNAREQFLPQNYNDVRVDQLTRTDDPSRGEKEQPPFLPPASSAT